MTLSFTQKPNLALIKMSDKWKMTRKALHLDYLVPQSPSAVGSVAIRFIDAGSNGPQIGVNPGCAPILLVVFHPPFPLNAKPQMTFSGELLTTGGKCTGLSRCPLLAASPCGFHPSECAVAPSQLARLGSFCCSSSGSLLPRGVQNLWAVTTCKLFWFLFPQTSSRPVTIIAHSPFSNISSVFHNASGNLSDKLAR